MTDSGERKHELYRQSSLGIALTDTLDDLIMNSLIEPTLAMSILDQFDKSITQALAHKVRTKSTIKGHLQVYRFCDEVWSFVIQDATFKLDHETLMTDKIKVVACAAKPAGQ